MFMVIFCFFFCSCFADIGRIQIGNQGNRSDPTEYTFNRNLGNIQRQLPFSAVVFSGADGSQIPKNDVVSH